MFSVNVFKQEKISNPFIGMWHIYEMEMWDEDYFNMERQAYVKIRSNTLGTFQFGLVEGHIKGNREEDGRFTFSWEGSDEMDSASGSGWLMLSDYNEIKGFIDFYQGDQSTFKARRAD